MNQILNYYDDYIVSNDDKKNINTSKIILFKIIFMISISLFLVLTIYFFYTQYNYKKDEIIAKEIIDSFNISTLYSDNASYSSLITSSEQSSPFSIIGIIEIPSLGINYPIISSVSEEYLKIAPCRFYGPLPNEIGNLCIAGHNYNNYKFFSRIKNLNLNDTINIFDLSGKKVVYSVYKKYEVNSTDFSCTNQNTNGKKEITLLTCNNIKGKRRVIKAVNKK